ncbi:MAG: M42 family metallopeptidase [Saprospiraceae bacterium]
MNYNSLKQLVSIDSPSGYTKTASQYIFDLLQEYGLSPSYTNKGAVKCALGENPTLSIAAHVDTLGAIVAGINSDGSLRISKIGGLSLNAYEGAYCRIRTLSDKSITGTLLLDNPAAHVNKELHTTTRKIDNMHVRLDEMTESEAETRALGIDVGDFICFETHYQELDSGFIKSKYMDNKAGCFVLLEIARQMKARNQSAPVELFFSNYEEVGHGAAAGFAPNIKEMLVIDMGVVGKNCAGKETACSICAKDSTGPYDYDFRKKLTKLAQENAIPHRVDVYPFYGSDGSAALRAGNNFRVALIGPGVSASHGVERTHKKGIEATIDLCLAYMKNSFS